jgi:hypothetical protein
MVSPYVGCADRTPEQITRSQMRDAWLLYLWSYCLQALNAASNSALALLGTGFA